jgi:carbon monoxide dehydrogenase subunit G
MIRLEQSIVIQRPLAEVFAFISNPGNDAQWNAPILRTRLLSEGPSRVGTTFQHDVELLGRRFETTVEITAYTPNERACVKTIGGPLNSTGCRIVEPVADGTRLIVTLEGEARGLLRLGEAVAARAARHQLETALAALKTLLETRSEQHATTSALDPG